MEQNNMIILSPHNGREKVLPSAAPLPIEQYSKNNSQLSLLLSLFIKLLGTAPEQK